jgi:hypothetical protein
LKASLSQTQWNLISANDPKRTDHYFLQSIAKPDYYLVGTSSDQIIASNNKSVLSFLQYDGKDHQYVEYVVLSI